MLPRFIRYRHYLPYCFEALFYLMLSKGSVLFRTFKAYAATLGVPQCETLKNDMSDKKNELAAIRLALRVVPRYLPWRSVCLDQAIAAQRMLVRRGFSCTVYFGVARQQNDGLLAHAWVRCGDQWIVGYQPQQYYQVVGSYATFARIASPI